MASYETEEEQVEAIKKWLKENGFWLIIGVAVGLGLLGGWRHWQNYTTQQGQQASTLYDQALSSLEEEKIKPAQEFAGKLLSEHSNSPYAALAALNLARQDMEAGDIDGSHVRLQWVIAQNTSFPELTHIARLRKARLFLSQDKRAEAKSLIEGIDAGAFKGGYAELQGDIAIAEGQLDAARTAYTEALKSEDLSLKHREWLQMKLEDLGGEKETLIEASIPLSAIGNPTTTQDDTVTGTEPTHPDSTQDAIGHPSTTQDDTVTATKPTRSDSTEDTSAPVSTQE